MVLSRQTIPDVLEEFIYILTCGDILILDYTNSCKSKNYLKIKVLISEINVSRCVLYEISTETFRKNELILKILFHFYRYIYKPITGPKRDLLGQLLATALCFSFVYLFHGIQNGVLIWSFLNFLGTFCETLGKAFWKTEFYQRIEVLKIKIRIENDFCLGNDDL